MCLIGAADNTDQPCGRLKIKMADIISYEKREKVIKQPGHFFFALRIGGGNGKDHDRIIVQVEVNAKHLRTGDKLIFT